MNQIVDDRAVLLPRAARELFRRGLVAPTAGWSMGWTQVNLIIVPRELAYDTLLFAQRNPKPCPVLDVFDPGEVRGVLLDGDVSTDLPLYRLWRHGTLVEETTDVRHVWRDDLVSFFIGCSFTFEGALIDAGIPIRHIEQCSNVPMYVTNRRCRSAGSLSGPLVVSMRPIPAEQVESARDITARCPGVHGAPVHVGRPEELGITDLGSPDFGEPVPIRPGDIPVFWACGVTAQAAVMESAPPLAITHAPGHMLITDARDRDYFM